MPLTHDKVHSNKAPIPLPVFSQAIKCGDMVFVSGNIGQDPTTQKVIEGTVGDRARRAILNIKAVLEEAGSSLDKIVKANVYLTDMANFAAVNKVYAEMIPGKGGAPMPARTCVCVKELPIQTDVEIECVAHL